MAPDSNNPWDRKPPEKPNPWGGPGNNRGNNRGGNNTPPDLDEMLKKLNEKFSQAFPGGFGPVQVGVALFAVIFVFWLLSGFYLVNPGENAVVTRFGKFSETQTAAGLGYRIPWPVDKVQVLNVSKDRTIQIGMDDGAGRRGSVSDESQMLTGDANIIEVGVVILWNIDDAKKYVFNIRDQEGTIKKVAESALREVVGQNDLWPIVTGNRGDVGANVKKIMQETLNDYNSGVSIKSVVIQQATVHPDVSDAFQDVTAATQDAVRVQNDAKIYRNKIVPEARGEAAAILQAADGYKQSIVTKAQGDAARFDATYAAYLEGKDVTRERLYIETMEQVMGKAQKIIVDRSAGNSGVIPYMPLNELKPAAGGPSNDDADTAKSSVAPVTVQPNAFGVK